MATQNIAYVGNGQIVAGPKNHLWVVVEQDNGKWFARVYERNTVIQERAEVDQAMASNTAYRFLDFLRARNWIVPTR